MTERGEKDESVVDVDEGPRDAHDGEAAGRDDVDVDEPNLEVVAERRRQHVRHELGQTEQRQRHRTLLQRDAAPLHVVTLNARCHISREA